MAIRPDPCLYRRRPTNALKEGLRQRSATSTRQRSVSGISSPFCKRKLVGSWLKVMPPDGRAAPANCPRTGRLSLRILLPAARRGAILRLSRRVHRRSPAWRRRRQRRTFMAPEENQPTPLSVKRFGHPAKESPRYVLVWNGGPRSCHAARN